MSWSEGLSVEQLAAVTQSGSPARLLAGPGTGKTLCLTRRVIRLIEDGGILPRDVLVLTFTRSATRELRRRILDVVGSQNRLPLVSTLHSFALRTLLRFPAATQLPQPLRIADDWEERQIIEEELKAMLGLPNVKEARELLEKLSADWEQLTADAADYSTHFPNPRFLSAWREHRRIYGYALRAELVYQLKHSLEEGALSDFRPPRHLVVDEYQDLNACDLAVVKGLSDRGSELYCAGDDDQSIYGFRYASPEGIRRFSTEYQPSAHLGLEECKRCDRAILEFALFVAAQDHRRIPKNLRPSPGAGHGDVHVLRFSNQNREANGVAAICEWLTRHKSIPPGRILILLRSDYQRVFSKPVRRELEARGLPVDVAANPLEPLDSDAGRGFYAILRLLSQPEDSLAWRTLLEVRRCGLGPAAFGAVYDIARQEGACFSHALFEIQKTPIRGRRMGPKLAEEVGRIRALLTELSTYPQSNLHNFINRIAERTIPVADVRAPMVSLFDRAMDLSSEPVTTLEELLRLVQTTLRDAEVDHDEEKIGILTMHQAKGLTADAVIVLAAEDEYVPGRDIGPKIDDARRLLYVSLTRAKHYLFVSHCQRRTGPQRRTGSHTTSSERHLTQFLRDAPVRSEDGDAHIAGLSR